MRLFDKWAEFELNFHQNAFRDNSDLIIVFVFLLDLLDGLKLYLFKADACLFLADALSDVFILFLESRN